MQKRKWIFCPMSCALVLCACQSPSPRLVQPPLPKLPPLGMERREPTFCQRLLGEFSISPSKATTSCATSMSASTSTAVHSK